MFTQIKSVLKKIIPPPTDVFYREINRSIKHSEKQTKVIADLVKQSDAKLSEQLKFMKDENKKLALRLAEMEKKTILLQKVITECKGYASETVWAEIFNNVISDSSWLHNTAFSAGRWAVGYPYLYVMYRILNEICPKRILDLGLGQSTRMIGQYTMANEDVMHFVVEHDPEWIAFFKRDFALSERSRIIQLDREMEPYKEASEVRVFKGFAERFKNEKFDFISIDAPLGGNMKQYSRIDVLKLLPDCLADDFIIMIDDSQRPGEMQTVEEMKEKLDNSGISYHAGKYSGNKDCVVICSANLKFVCSM